MTGFTGLETKRLKDAINNGAISKEMSKKDLYINKILELLSDKARKELIKAIK